MKYKRILLFFSCLISIGLFNNCKSRKNITIENRFENYIPLSNKEDTIKTVFIQWASLDRPNFIKQSDLLKYDNTDSLINYCFFIDTKDTSIWNFVSESNPLKKPNIITLYGKFYKTKKFDGSFPYIGWEPETFKPDINGYYKVFVYRKYSLK